MKPNLLDFTYPELERFCSELGEAPFRARQVWQWLWQKRERDFGRMTNISKEMRERLGREADVVWPEAVQVQTSRDDGTTKFLLALADGQRIESVLIPEKDHFTLCLSTQVGCAFGCTFCATGRMGLVRNLTMAEILGQILMAQEHVAGLPTGLTTGQATGVTQGLTQGLALRNLVFMGMGEPLLNWENLRRALEALHHPTGLNFSKRRITVSTVGVPGMLAELGALGFASLAVSLHAPTQELRARIMPKAARFPLDDLIADLAAYPLQPRQKITIEYVMLGGVNDDLSHARELVRLLNKVKAKVNLIPFHPSPELPYAAPDMNRVLAFENLLKTKGLPATLRKSKGQDISAACGQLRAEMAALE
ncbi:23S rRNA (adenine(2503)-C(2))-methyltransferase RlmN [Desulfonatronum sp. SC1]|uniref:23S rRNA (adenine(2503)-C(2))-methyltransferase RlmN n=1 Tax=Desulfonatronum sp. SC1 TaxID=2109626 RepID=UPI000D3011FB|nr:23S rRNA (adenine(2503)-C(2))-methyltransferase RlmN [Desulfonatronum sp. SC1]PTN39073.1 23S rRNA (adenine(2503)-C(2))-methyltransferase RlmN [Desulfonatronum sp. SC1]